MKIEHLQTAPAFLTPREVAVLLRCRRQTVYDRISKGSIPAVRLDPHAPLLVPRERLVALLSRGDSMSIKTGDQPTITTPPRPAGPIAKPK
jgi:Helix-turn-helix domain